jgi:N4-gp56 family major capsid protein
MPAPLMIYNDISPRTQAHADRRLLTRQKLNNILGQFGQARMVPGGATKTVIFRRYNKLAPATVPLQEGVTPSGKVLTKTDVVAQLAQYGDFIGISDVIRDTHEDPILQESTDILGDQADETWDILRAGKLKAGTNVLYANGTARSAVNTAITRALLKRADRILGRQEAKVQREIVTAGPNIGTSPIAPAFIVCCHVDLIYDCEAMGADWTPIEKYSSTMGLINGERGASGMFRFVVDNNLTPFADAGGAKGAMISTTGTSADVYPVLIFGKDAYGTVALAGKNAVQVLVANPKASESDPLAQRGTVAWKGYCETAILNDLWMLRLEVACTA